MPEAVLDEATKPDFLKEWVLKRLELVSLEHQEQIKQNQELRANNTIEELEFAQQALTNIVIKNVRDHFNAQVFIMVQNPDKNKFINFKNSKLLKGFVGITIDDETDPIATGYALKISPNELEIDCDTDITKIECNNFNFIKFVNDVEYNRVQFTLRKMLNFSARNHLIPSLFSNPVPKIQTLPLIKRYSSNLRLGNLGTDSIIWFNQKLNDSQKEAVKFSLFQKHLAVIHGPPGTGKTTTLTELILQLITRGYKILVCAPSNVAVDNIFKQLIDSHHKNLCTKYGHTNYKFVRVGSPVRIDSQIKKYALISKIGPKKAIKSEFETNQLKKRLRNANVIMSTLCSSSIHDGIMKHLYDDILKFSFDVVIVDECAQANEPLTWIPLLYAKKCILAGDHKQLPPTIFSVDAANQGLKESLLERAINLFKGEVVRMLNVQHRMNQEIMEWPSYQFYEGQLIAADSVAFKRLILKKNKKALPAIRMVETSGCGMFEMTPSSNNVFKTSKANIHEMKIVAIIVQDLINQGVSASDIGIITPYSLQTFLVQEQCRRLFKRHILDKLEINSVDGFQGREKEAIIFSMVRSNPKGEIGFLREERRLNVAITRARKHLTIIGDSATVTKYSDEFRSFFGYVLRIADIESGLYYQDRMDQLKSVDLSFMESNSKKKSSKQKSITWNGPKWRR